MEENVCMCICAPHITKVNVGDQGRDICITDFLLVLLMLWLNLHIMLSDIRGWLAHLVS